MIERELEAFVDRVLGRLEDTPVALAPGAPDPSMFSGGAGVAFFLHESARLREDDRLLPLAREWTRAARRWTENAGARAWNGAPFGLVLGETGLSFVEALLDLRDGDASGVLHAAERIERAAGGVSALDRLRPSELFGGAAGIACATRCLTARLPAIEAYDAPRGALGRVRDRAVALALRENQSAIDRGRDDRLGFAHGVAGELWSLLATLGAENEVVRERLAELAALRELDEDGLLYWSPGRDGATTLMLGMLCNGMPGHTLLWCEVVRQTESDAAMELASRSAESTAVLVTGVPTLCCGLAGQAVALYRYAEVSGDARYVRRADARLRRAIRIVEESDDANFLDLWQGVLGIALVALGRVYRERGIPCFEPLLNRGS